MKFGKITDQNLLNEIDFRVPEVNQYSSKKSVETLQLFFGAPLWNKKEWVGKIYPKDAKQKDFLKHYSKTFNSIELNASYYRTPSSKTIQNWLEQVNENKEFLFCPKVNQGISHYGGLGNVEKGLEFTDQVREFGDKLGPCFLQLNQNFDESKKVSLFKFLENWPVDLKLAVEFRHESWFKNKKLFDYLASKNISTVITDTAGRRDLVHMNITSDFLILRWVGNNLHDSDYERLDLWMKNLDKIKKAGVKQFFFFVHEPDDKFCPEVVEYLKERRV